MMWDFCVQHDKVYRMIQYVHTTSTLNYSRAPRKRLHRLIGHCRIFHPPPSTHLVRGCAAHRTGRGEQMEKAIEVLDAALTVPTSVPPTLVVEAAVQYVRLECERPFRLCCGPQCEGPLVVGVDRSFHVHPILVVGMASIHDGRDIQAVALANGEGVGV